MPVSAGTPLDPAVTRAKVLDAATELFYARGIHTVGVDEIARTAGTSKLSLYRHFGSKDLLVDAVMTARSDRVHAWLATKVQHLDDSPSGRLLAIFDAICEWYAEPGFRGCAIVNAATDTRGDQRASTVTLSRHHLARYQEMFETELAAMGVDDPANLARQLLVLLEGATTIAAIEGTPDAGNHARHMAETLLSSATPTPPVTPGP